MLGMMSAMRRTRSSWLGGLLCVVLLGGSSLAWAQKNPYVGNVPMSPKVALIENVSASPIHTKLVALLKAAGLDAKLSDSGPYTLFAPTDDAFQKLPPGTQTGLLKPESREQLSKVLLYHVVQGKLTQKKLGKLLKKGHGTTTLQTLAGAPLTIAKTGSILILTDAKGNTATVITPDVLSKNGVYHVIDSVLMPG